MNDLAEAIEILKQLYETAKESDYIRNPLAWALYHTWRQFDDNFERRQQRERRI